MCQQLAHPSNFKNSKGRRFIQLQVIHFHMKQLLVITNCHKHTKPLLHLSYHTQNYTVTMRHWNPQIGARLCKAKLMPLNEIKHGFLQICQMENQPLDAKSNTTPMDQQKGTQHDQLPKDTLNKKAQISMRHFHRLQRW